MKELILEARKTGDGADARRVLEAANQMGAIATVDYVRLSRELENLRAVSAMDKTGEKPGKTDLPVGFHPMPTKAGEGDKFVNYALGSGKGKCDEVVSFLTGAKKGNKTLISAHSGYAVELVGVVDGKEQQLVKKEAELQHAADFCRTTLAEMGKEREALEARLQELTTQAGDGEKPSEALQKVQADLAVLEKQEKEFSTGLKTAEANLEEVQQTLRKERVQNFREGEHNMMREKEARAAIEFVDGAGLAVLGADNVQAFFNAINNTYSLPDEQKIDPAKRAISDEQKHLIIRVFSRMLGSSDGVAGMFDPTTHALRDGIGDGAVKNALQQNGLYNPAAVARISAAHPPSFRG